jgi:hypothetical protein
MQIRLNPAARQQMLFIGNIVLTMDEPGPIDINVKDLGDSEKRQIMSSIQRGTLQARGFEELQAAMPAPLPEPFQPANASPPAQPIQPVVPTISDEEWTKLLTGSLATIKKEVSGLAPAAIRKLVEVRSARIS